MFTKCSVTEVPPSPPSYGWRHREGESSAPNNIIYFCLVSWLLRSLMSLRHTKMYPESLKRTWISPDHWYVGDSPTQRLGTTGLATQADPTAAATLGSLPDQKGFSWPVTQRTLWYLPSVLHMRLWRWPSILGNHEFLWSQSRISRIQPGTLCRP